MRRLMRRVAGRIARMVPGAPLGRARFEQDSDEELAFHLESRAADLQRRGLSAEEARRRARVEFGATARYKEELRDGRSGRLARIVDDLGRDLVYAWRSLRRSPGLLITCVLSLGLGLGVNITLFSGIHAIFFSVPTAARADRLVGVEPGNSNHFSYLNYRDLRDSGIFADVAGSRVMSLNLRADGRLEKALALVVTPNFFEMLGVGARLGRVFTPADAGRDGTRDGDLPLAVLSHGYWTRRFGADPAAIGRTINLNGQASLVLGVLPDGYRPVTVLEPDVYVPVSRLLMPNLDVRQNANALTVIGRLRDGITPEQARVGVTALGQRLEQAWPGENDGFSRPAQVFPLAAMGLRGAPSDIYLFPVLLLVLFGLVLLIACANVAGLLLARAAGRRREMAVRVAIGARRWRLIQSMLAESVVLALLGGAAGLLLAHGVSAALGLVRLSGGQPLRLMIAPGASVYLYGFVVSLLTGVICGIAPALRATRASVIAEVQQGGGHGATGRLWLRHALVIGQVAASLILLVVSSLMLRSMLRVASLDPGFDVTHGLVASIELEPTRRAEQSHPAFAQRLVERLEAVPGVQSVALANLIPLAGDSAATSFRVADASSRSTAETGGPGETGKAGARTGARTLLNSVGPRYFETMGIPLVRGREFSPADRAGAPPVVIVNESFARSYFPGQDPIGQRVGNDREPYAEIVGVVRDSKAEFISQAAKPLLYRAYAQRPGALRVHLRMTTPNAAAAIPSVSRALVEFDSRAIADVRTLRDATRFEFQMRRGASVLLGALGLLGLLLAVIGLYGVMAFVVASRTLEIGIRMALGASTRRVLWSVLSQGLTLVAIGILAGGLLALLLTRPLAAILAGVQGSDPIAFLATTAALVLTGLAASYVPARRATRVDPTVALRDH